MPLRENLWRDTVAQVDTKKAVCVEPRQTIREALSLMQREHVGSLLVREDDRLVGIFTERDFLKRVIGERRDIGAEIGSVMTPNPTTAREDEVVGSVIQKMQRGGYRRLPVVDEQGKTIGRVSIREIVHYMVEHFPKAVYNLPPKPDQVQTAREGA